MRVKVNIMELEYSFIKEEEEKKKSIIFGDRELGRHN